MSEVAVAADDVTFRVELTPHPPVAFARMRVRVRAERIGAPASLEAGTVRFEMAMPMGDHSYTLVPGDGGWYEADVTLPQCVTGDRRWFATVEATIAGHPRRVRFRFDLARLE